MVGYDFEDWLVMNVRSNKIEDKGSGLWKETFVRMLDYVTSSQILKKN